MSEVQRSVGIVPVGDVSQRILIIRGQRVILDADLSRLYGVTTKRLNEQIRRNSERFPDDFLFQLTSEEKQQVVANCDHLKNLRFSPGLPYAFTEHGAIMAATVLNSEQAVKVGVYVVRAFVQLRELLGTHQQLSRKLDELERKFQKHDVQILTLIDAIRQLMTPPKPKRKASIGFLSELKRKRK
jgi:hypothetical protein